MLSHSSQEGILLAAGARIGRIQLYEDQHSLALIRASLAPGAQIILSSCFTGYEDKETRSTARALADLTDATVIAPDFLTRGISRCTTEGTVKFKRMILLGSTRAPVYKGRVGRQSH